MIVVILFLVLFITIFAGATESFATISTILACGIYYYFTMYGYKNGDYTLNDYIEETITYKIKKLFNNQISKEEYNSIMGAELFYANDVKEMMDKSDFSSNDYYNECLYIVMDTQKSMIKHIKYFYGVRYKEKNLRYTMYSYDFYNLLIKILCPPLEKEYWKRMGINNDVIGNINLKPFMKTLINTAYKNEYINSSERNSLLKYYNLPL